MITALSCNKETQPDKKCHKWNGTPLTRRGSNFYFFAAPYCSRLEFNALFACLSCFLLPACPPNKGGGNKGNIKVLLENLQVLLESEIIL